MGRHFRERGREELKTAEPSSQIRAPTTVNEQLQLEVNCPQKFCWEPLYNRQNQRKLNRKHVTIDAALGPNSQDQKPK